MAEQPDAVKTTFRTVFEVGPDALAQTQDMAGAFQYAIAPATVDHDFGEIRRAAEAVPDSSTVKIIRGWGLQETAPVGVMVLSLREAVRQGLAQPFGNPAFWAKAEAALADVFVGLGDQEGTHLSFHGDATDSTSYYYNLLFALQDEETEGFVHALAFCVHVTVALPGNEVRTLTVDDIARCAIRVDAVAVRQAVRTAAV
ncbi:Type-2Aa cytolytic delta-endotoxin [Streptomyces sp. NPDC048506]|uniref:Type-2Aa cytolytic delta-endotoxin n=1 Tax=Streptomyces sp. NPDC048506 TaxID=3155028 RepID=UPI0034431DC3